MTIVFDTWQRGAETNLREISGRIIIDRVTDDDFILTIESAGQKASVHLSRDCALLFGEGLRVESSWHKKRR